MPTSFKEYNLEELTEKRNEVRNLLATWNINILNNTLAGEYPNKEDILEQKTLQNLFGSLDRIVKSMEKDTTSKKSNDFISQLLDNINIISSGVAKIQNK